MPRAIVSITCPQCGGRVDGIESIDVPQRRPCPYCRTELHVPHVGERIIERQLIREVVVPDAPVPCILEAEPEKRVLGAIGVIAMGLIGVIYLIASHSSSYSPVTKSESSYDRFKQCEQTCEASCGARPDDRWQDRPDYNAYDIDGMNKSVDWTLCSGRCTLSCSK